MNTLYCFYFLYFIFSSPFSLMASCDSNVPTDRQTGGTAPTVIGYATDTTNLVSPEYSSGKRHSDYFSLRHATCALVSGAYLLNFKAYIDKTW